jgi:16S rRNA (guanine966-N2)-methyltransferase
MRTQLRIVAGSLRGRKVVYTIDREVRPMPDRVRQALFNMLGDAIPGRVFVDLFAGTGAVGIEALSRGAASVEFVERDARVAVQIMKHLQSFGVAEQARVHRADVHRWAERWQAPEEPVTLFLGPPYPALEDQPERFMTAIENLQAKAAPVSIIVLQSDKGFGTGLLPDPTAWEHRIYGRNRLSTWIKKANG